MGQTINMKAITVTSIRGAASAARFDAAVVVALKYKSLWMWSSTAFACLVFAVVVSQKECPSFASATHLTAVSQQTERKEEGCLVDKIPSVGRSAVLRRAFIACNMSR